MALVTLPAFPGPRAVEPVLQDFGSTMRGALGGTSQRVNRLGSRWGIRVTMPAMTPQDAYAWEAALVRGLRNGVSWSIRQVGMPNIGAGTVLVAGASQAGDSVDLDGLVPGTALHAGRWASILTGGQRYLYKVAETVLADASGTATVEIEPPLRVSPADNDPVEIAAPVIEGLLDVAPSLEIAANRLMNGFSFEILETR